MSKVDLEKFTKEELEKIVVSCFDKTELATKLGFTFANSKVHKKVVELVNSFNISMDHFDPSKKNKARRKYPVIKKVCPICQIEFETQQGHPRETETCSCKCANTFFSDLKHGPEQRLKTSQSLLKYLESSNQTELVNKEVLFKKICAICFKGFNTKKGSTRCCSHTCGAKLRSENPEYIAGLSLRFKERVANGTHKGWSSRSKLIPSFPEKVVIEILTELNYSLIREYKMSKWFVDFADIDRKIAIEIDGKQHELPERKASDIVKDAYLVSQGWTVHRIKWKRTTKEFREEVKNKLKEILTGISV